METKQALLVTPRRTVVVERTRLDGANVLRYTFIKQRRSRVLDWLNQGPEFWGRVVTGAILAALAAASWGRW